VHTVIAADPGTPGLAELVAELTAASPEFTTLWRRHDVRRRRGDRKTFHHPVAGTITFTYEVLYLESCGQRMTIYQTAPGTPDHAAMLELSRRASGRLSAAT
jgi:MmyB-like transcription regulator ligand binding domain